MKSLESFKKEQMEVIRIHLCLLTVRGENNYGI